VCVEDIVAFRNTEYVIITSFQFYTIVRVAVKNFVFCFGVLLFFMCFTL